MTKIYLAMSGAPDSAGYFAEAAFSTREKYAEWIEKTKDNRHNDYRSIEEVDFDPE